MMMPSLTLVKLGIREIETIIRIGRQFVFSAIMVVQMETSTLKHGETPTRPKNKEPSPQRY
jgi:hypothetical protein